MKIFTALVALWAITLASSAFAETFDAQVLLAAARNEPPLQVYDSTGKIKEQAKKFAEKYGIAAGGTKSKVTQTIKIVISEQKAGNVHAGVIIVSDAPSAMTQLIKPGYVQNYVPSDMAEKIPEMMQNPLFVVSAANVFSYNTALNKGGCPVDNIWALTDPKWRGHVAMQDPLGKPALTNWFNQLKTYHDGEMAKAYEDYYGKPFKAGQGSAAQAWVVGLAKNKPLLTSSDGNAAEAVGAPDTKENFIGLFSTAKFRENKNGMTLGMCTGLRPFMGYSLPSSMFIVKGTPSPNAAKLFVHYMLTAEGIAPQAADGKRSSNPENKLPANEPSGIAAYFDALTPYHAQTAGDDWNARQDWQDIWSINVR